MSAAESKEQPSLYSAILLVRRVFKSNNATQPPRHVDYDIHQSLSNDRDIDNN